MAFRSESLSNPPGIFDMIHYTQGNLLEAETDALVNTVNTVGVMGKGIALMFKEQFPDNFKAYAAACKQGEVQTGRMFVTSTSQLHPPRWIINFPTKRHWRNPSQLEWINEGLVDLRRVLIANNIQSVAIPPLGSGNGQLVWGSVQPLIEQHLGDLPGIDVVVYEPTRAYHNVSKSSGIEQLTPPRAMIAEMIRRYEVLGLECTILEVQKLAWVLNRVLNRFSAPNPLKLTFVAERYGPYADNLRHVLDALDGSYLHCDKRLADASPTDLIEFAPTHATKLKGYLQQSDNAIYVDAIDQTDAMIDGFQSPLGMEALATVGWLIDEMQVEPDLPAIRRGIDKWPHSRDAAARKQQIFGDALLLAAIDRITGS